AIFGAVDELMDEGFAVFAHAVDESAGEKAGRLAEGEGDVDAAAGDHFAAEAVVFFFGEDGVEGLAVGRDHGNLAAGNLPSGHYPLSLKTGGGRSGRQPPQATKSAF